MGLGDELGINIVHEVEDHYSLPRQVQKVEFVSNEDGNENSSGNENDGRKLYFIDSLTSQFHISYSLVKIEEGEEEEKYTKNKKKKRKSRLGKRKASIDVDSDGDEIIASSSVSKNEFKLKTIKTENPVNDADEFFDSNGYFVHEKANQSSNSSVEEKETYFSSHVINQEPCSIDIGNKGDSDSSDTNENNITGNSIKKKKGKKTRGSSSQSLAKSRYKFITRVSQVTIYETFSFLIHAIIVYPALLNLAFIIAFVLNLFVQTIDSIAIEFIKGQNSNLFYLVCYLPVLVTYVYFFAWVVSISIGFILDIWQDFEFINTFTIIPHIIRQWFCLSVALFIPFLTLSGVYFATGQYSKAIQYSLFMSFACFLLLLAIYCLAALLTQINLWSNEVNSKNPFKLLKRVLQIRIEGLVNYPYKEKLFFCCRSCVHGGCCACQCLSNSDHSKRSVEEDSMVFGGKHRFLHFICLGKFSKTELLGTRRWHIVNAIILTALIWLILYFLILRFLISNSSRGVYIGVGALVSLFVILFLAIRSYRAFKSLEKMRIEHSLLYRQSLENQDSTRMFFLNETEKDPVISTQTPSLVAVLIFCFFIFLILFVFPIISFVGFGDEGVTIGFYSMYFLFSSLRWIFSPQALFKRVNEKEWLWKSHSPKKRRLYLLVNRIDRTGKYGYIGLCILLLVTGVCLTLVVSTTIPVPTENTVLPVVYNNSTSGSRNTATEFPFKYPLCQQSNIYLLDNTNYSFSDFSIFSEVALLNETSAQARLNTYFLDEKLELINVSETTFSSFSYFYSIYDSVNDIVFITVRGSSNDYYTGNLAIWFEAIVLELIRFSYPFGHLWDFAYPDIAWLMSVSNSNSISYDLIEYYIALIRDPNSSLGITVSNIYLTGFGVGGGLAGIVGSRSKTPTIVFSALNSGMLYKKLGFGLEDMDNNVVNVVPENNIIGSLGFKPLLSQAIYCNENDITSCYNLQWSICELQKRCGVPANRAKLNCTE